MPALAVVAVAVEEEVRYLMIVHGILVHIVRPIGYGGGGGGYQGGGGYSGGGGYGRSFRRPTTRSLTFNLSGGGYQQGGGGYGGGGYSSGGGGYGGGY